jgi:amidophosphoribosyltransferase
LQRGWARRERHQGHGAGVGDLYRRCAGEAAGAYCDRAYALLDDGRFGAAECAADLGRVTKGLIAIAHNGNLVNLGNSKARLERDGAVFQTTSDSEIIVQLIAHSRCNTLVDCIAESLAQVEGAFSIVMMTRNRIFAARDPHGFRPLSMGRIAGVDGAPDTFVFASETCAFDLLHAKYERDVEPGELVMVSEDGVTSRAFARDDAAGELHLRACVLCAAGLEDLWPLGAAVARGDGPAAGARVGVDADLVVPVPDSGVTAAIGYAAESGIPFNLGLIRNHYVGRTFIQPEQRVRDFGVRMKLNPVRNLLEGKRVCGAFRCRGVRRRGGWRRGRGGCGRGSRSG